MNAPIIDHLDDFEAAIAAICRRNIILDRSVTRVLKAAEQREAEAAEWIDWYAEERTSRTGSA